jgi:hypothetical protein
VIVGTPHPASIAPTPRFLWTVRHFFTLRSTGAERRARANDLAQIDELVRRWSPAWNVPPGGTDAVKVAFREPGCLDAALGYFRAIPARLPAWQRRPLDVPTVCFAGTDDTLAPEMYDRRLRVLEASPVA